MSSKSRAFSRTSILAALATFMPGIAPTTEQVDDTERFLAEAQKNLRARSETDSKFQKAEAKRARKAHKRLLDAEK